MNPNMLLQMMMQRNPRMQNNPITNQYIQIIQSNDSKRGEQIADNICAAYGKTREQMIAEARQYFHI